MTIDQDKLTKLSYDPASERFSLTDEQAYALADPDGLSLPGAFMLALGALRTESQVTDAFRTGAGIGWREHHPDVFTGCDAPASGQPTPESPTASLRGPVRVQRHL